MEYYQIDIHERTLQRSFRKHINGARMYKKARVKEISKKNKKIREKYGWNHGDKTIKNF